MDFRLQQQLYAAARAININLDSTVAPRLDDYIREHFPRATSDEQKIIQVFLGNAAIKIANAEGKDYVKEDDVKAAIWFFHVPQDPTDPCRLAGEYILQNQSSLAAYLSPELRSMLADEGGTAAH
jgi:hypothetical protein